MTMHLLDEIRTHPEGPTASGDWLESADEGALYNLSICADMEPLILAVVYLWQMEGRGNIIVGELGIQVGNLRTACRLELYRRGGMIRIDPPISSIFEPGAARVYGISTGQEPA